MSNKTGVPTSVIVSTKVKNVKCDCKQCYHVNRKTVGKGKNKHYLYHCVYYDLINPNKKTCARFYKIDKYHEKHASKKLNAKNTKRKQNENRKTRTEAMPTLWRRCGNKIN